MSKRFNELEQVQKKLKALVARLPVDDAKTISAALESLQRLGIIQDDLADLADVLEEIDEQYTKDATDNPDQLKLTELVSSIHALGEVSRFLRGRGWSASLERLQVALAQLVVGGPAAAMFHPLKLKGSGRRPDVPTIQAVKGALAGLMYGQQAAGMSRQQAAAWIASNISPELASRISGKPITARMVEEWLDRYGGNSPPDNAGGKAFKVWKTSIEYSPFTKRKFREITERIAQTYPARQS
jgi:hypothetical protein